MHYEAPVSTVNSATDNKSGESGPVVDVAILEKRLTEVMFISRFIGATSASLVPQDICSIAARILFDYIPYKSILFSLSKDFGINPLFFSPGKQDDDTCQKSTESFNAVPFTESFISRGPQSNILISDDLGQKRIEMVLPEQMGRVRICFDTLAGTNFSTALFSEIAGNFACTLKNSLTHEKIKELATKDGLTGLFNRRVFDELLSVEIKRKELMPVSLLLIDLDDFKKVNDNFGHPAGDQVLATMGKILREGCRGSDLVARYGGEEFAVMLPSTSPAVAFEIAKRLKSRIAGTVYVFEERSVNLTASIGIAHTTEGRNDAISQLVSRADQALYRAKKSGKNIIFNFTDRSKGKNKNLCRDSQIAWLRSA